jgi:hypothetical protein
MNDDFHPSLLYHFAVCYEKLMLCTTETFSQQDANKSFDRESSIKRKHKDKNKTKLHERRFISQFPLKLRYLL